ncbi:MAG: Hint domain-containing protein [Pseudomonadota bacterium]
MPTPVPADSTDVENLATAEVLSGPSAVHIGGGYFLASFHGSAGDVLPASGLDAEGPTISTDRENFTILGEREDYNDDNGEILAGFDMIALDGSASGYDGPAARMLIFADPDAMAGPVTLTGYPDSSGEQEEETGTLLPGSHIEESVGGQDGGYFRVLNVEAEGGMSGGGLFLEADPGGTGDAETFFIGTLARAGEIGDVDFVEATSISSQYALITETLQAAGADPDDIPDPVIVASGGPLSGTFLNEEIWGSAAADDIDGAGGDDRIDAGAGSDRISGGDGADIVAGGAGADTFAAGGYGDGSDDLITDFNPDEDTLEIGRAFASVEAFRAAADTIEGTTVVDLGEGGTLTLSGVSLEDVDDASLSLACFVAGTKVMTPAGPRPVEELRPGAMVDTPQGPVPLLRALVSAPTADVAPIEIGVGALGDACPSRPICVSPAHRVLLTGRRAALLFDVPEVLVAAGDLLGHPGIRERVDLLPTLYVHLLFAHHTLVETSGLWSESFHTADATPELRAEIGRLFPDRPELLSSTAPAYPVAHPGEVGVLSRGLATCPAQIAAI